MTTSRSKVQPKKKSKPIPSNIKQRALVAFQKLRRLEEANYKGRVICISCGKDMDWKEAQGGHYISRTVEATCDERDNVWPQCPQCNGYKKGNIQDYRFYLVRKIGEERVKRIECMRMAARGDQEALSSLSPTDRFKVTSKKGKVYWKTRYDEFMEEIKKLESQF